jgi:hypothetical protein
VEVARFITNLVRCPLMKSVDLVYSQQKNVSNSPVREFQVKMELKPNVDVIDVLRSADRTGIGRQPSGQATPAVPEGKPTAETGGQGA